MILFQEPKYFDKDKYSIIKIDIDIFDDLWKKDPFYTDKNCRGLTNKEKYDFYLKRYLSKKEYEIEPPTVIFDSTQLVGILDGRHRYSVYRDMGEKEIPIIALKDQLYLFDKYHSLLISG